MAVAYSNFCTEFYGLLLRLKFAFSLLSYHLLGMGGRFNEIDWTLRKHGHRFVILWYCAERVEFSQTTTRMHIGGTIMIAQLLGAAAALLARKTAPNSLGPGDVSQTLGFGRLVLE